MSKQALVPTVVFLFTILTGLILLYTAFRVQKEDSVTPTAPEGSEAQLSCTLEATIKDERHLECIDNTCTEVIGAGGNTCSTVGSSEGCFVCENLVAEPASGRPELAVVFTPKAKSQKDVTYIYDFGDGSSSVTKTDAQNVSHTYTSSGDYTAKLDVKSTKADGSIIVDLDNPACQVGVNVTEIPKKLGCNGDYVCEEVECTDVSDCNNHALCNGIGDDCLEGPVCKGLSASKTSGKLDSDSEFKVTFDGIGTGEDIVYKFIFGDGESVSTENDEVVHTYTEKGEYDAKLQILSYDKVSEDVAACNVTINIVEPEDPVCLKLLASPRYGDEPLEVEFTGAGDAEGDITYEFTFGDGDTKSTTDSRVKHTYTEGEYTAKLKILADNKESEEIGDCTVAVRVYQEDEDTYFACRNEACVELSGDKADTCDEDSDCEEKAEDTHLVCRNQACVLVSGIGESECSKNSDCVVRTVVEETTPTSTPTTAAETEATPAPVPDTGVNDFRLYIAIAVGMITAGLVLVGKNIL